MAWYRMSSGTDTSDATATASNILSGKTAYVNDNKITGTMANKSGTTVTASSVSQDSDYVNLDVPSNGYYSTSSKIRTLISNIFSGLSCDDIVKSNTYSNGDRTIIGEIPSNKKGYIVVFGAYHAATTGATNVTLPSGVTLVAEKKIQQSSSSETGVFFIYSVESSTDIRNITELMKCQKSYINKSNGAIFFINY